VSGPDELILAVDTAGADAGVVVAGDGRIDSILLSSKAGGFARTEDLAGEVSALLAARGRTVQEITLLGAVVGPGSYTGLRSGLAFLRGLAFADSIPAVAVGSLELLAWRGAREGETVIAMAPAGSQRFAAATYRRAGDVVELAAPVIVEAGECAAHLSARDSAVCAVIGEAPRTAASGTDGARPSALAGFDSLGEAARALALELRVAQSNSLEDLAFLVASRGRRGRAVRVESLLPVYVGQASARPNRHRVAVLDVSE